MPRLIDAKILAESLLAVMMPYCEKAIIAGSIRREKAEVKDIELVVIPRYEEREFPSDDLFSVPQTFPVNTLFEWATRGGGSVIISWIKPGTHEIIYWTIKEDGKYWRGLVGDGCIKLDLFLVQPRNFGLHSVIRTGPADFSAALMTYLKQGGRFHVDKGLLWNEKTEIVTCETEEDFFAAIGIKFIPVEYRETWRDFKKLEGR